MSADADKTARARQADRSQRAGGNFFFVRCTHLDVAALFCQAQRFFCARETSLRAAADTGRRFLGPLVAGLPVLTGGLPRRFAGDNAPSLVPSKACIAASSLLRSPLRCWVISFTFMDLS